MDTTKYKFMLFSSFQIMYLSGEDVIGVEAVIGGDVVGDAVGKCPSNKTSRIVEMMANFLPVQYP